ncbi:MAG: methyltransferase domain-containing protein [Steroidobacteraceae bacterium]
MLTDVVIGNIEQISLPYEEESFDALILSEVLEHLVDPAAALHKLVKLVKLGGRVFASSPNISHRSVIAGLEQGEFRYTSSGLMDCTHLRWFTPRSFQEMFECAGVKMDWIGPLGTLSRKQRLFSKLLPWRAHTFWYQINFHGSRRSRLGQ